MTSTCPEYGFQVEFEPVIGAESSVKLAWKEMLAEFLATIGMAISYSFPDGFRFIVVRDGSQATEADRQTVIDWGKHSQFGGKLRVGTLLDLNDMR